MRTTRFAALVALLVFASPGAPAAEWPSRPIRIIAPSTPRGAADTFAQLLAEFLPPLLHQPVIVDNRPGGGGLIGAAAAAHAEPDGYTLVTASVAYHAIAPAVSPNPGFDPIRDFTHIAFLGGEAGNGEPLNAGRDQSRCGQPAAKGLRDAVAGLDPASVSLRRRWPPRVNP
jgi:tripartite-type tricarboxylate transporter receptor subunit TctC